jgi:transposase
MTDARSLSRQALEQKRAEVIRLHLDAIPVMEICERTGLNWGTVNTTIKRYLAEGESALLPKARGRKPGSGRALTTEQEAEIRMCLRKRPMQQRLSGSVWNRAVLSLLITQKTSFELSDRVVGSYLKRWGLVLPSANKLLPAQCTPTVRLWLADHYSAIEEQASTSGAMILWLFRPVRLDVSHWMSASEVSSMLKNGTKEVKFAGVFAVNNQGKQHWIISKGVFDAKQQIAFLKAVMKDFPRKPIILIRASEHIYRNQDVIDWLHDHERVKMYPPMNIPDKV